MRWMEWTLKRLQDIVPDAVHNPDLLRQQEAAQQAAIDAMMAQRADRHIDQITKTIGTMIYSNVITDRELGMAVGKLQDKDPELAMRLSELRSVIKRMGADDTV